MLVIYRNILKICQSVRGVSRLPMIPFLGIKDFFNLSRDESFICHLFCISAYPVQAGDEMYLEMHHKSRQKETTTKLNTDHNKQLT